MTAAILRPKLKIARKPWKPDSQIIKAKKIKIIKTKGARLSTSLKLKYSVPSIITIRFTKISSPFSRTTKSFSKATTSPALSPSFSWIRNSCTVVEAPVPVMSRSYSFTTSITSALTISCNSWCTSCAKLGTGRKSRSHRPRDKIFLRYIIKII